MRKAAYAVDELFALSHRFGAAEAKQKQKLLEDIAALDRLSARRIILLHDTLYFMRAYPDNGAVLNAVHGGIAALRDIVDTYTGGDARHHAFENTGLPGSCNTYEYSYAVLLRLVKMFPGCLEIDWDGVEDQSVLGDALMLTTAAAEERGLEDEYVTLQEWLQVCKSRPSQTDLEVLLQLFRRSTLSAYQQEHAFENCELPVVYDLRTPRSGRCEVGVTPDSVVFQKRPIAKERFPLRSEILRPLTSHSRLSRAAGRQMIDVALTALCSRNLEIHSLVYANPEDVIAVDCGRGLQVVLAGVVPEFRSALESNLFFMILKNGVPIAYGPASIFLGCCEMGINLFSEFRGGEIRYIYAQFMRVLYHVAKVQYFFLVSYGMGEGNPEALKSGAFWFYRKLGFRASNPDVESLARQEEAIMRRKPGHRSSMKTLRALSYTDAYFDLSGGACKPLDFAAIGRAVSRCISTRFDGDRRRAGVTSARAVVRDLEIADIATWTADEKRGMQQLAPVICLLRGFGSWPARDKRPVVRMVRAKGGRSELDYIDAVSRVPRLANELRELGSREAAG